MSVNEVYPFLYDVAKKGIHDNNPFVRKIALVSLFKVKQMPGALLTRW